MAKSPTTSTRYTATLESNDRNTDFSIDAYVNIWLMITNKPVRAAIWVNSTFMILRVKSLSVCEEAVGKEHATAPEIVSGPKPDRFEEDEEERLRRPMRDEKCSIKAIIRASVQVEAVMGLFGALERCRG